MRTAIVVVVLVGLCGCGSKTPQESLVGSWLFTSADGSGGIGVTFNADGTYGAVTLVLTSTASADTEIEKGTYSATASSLTSMPTQWSCPGPDSISTVSYSFAGGNLVLTSPNDIVTFAPNNATSGSTIALEIGCFDANGAFTAEPLAPVTN
jgi:hypothetical protein